ncbi:hypothetical protein EJ994_00210 [Maribacter sp. MJ134]|uniref:hypothetical protein n=1 Tax=Maribacter sp. MJ134 TaxID=2496865 RepID=UPI000F842EAA|nr:hypothetical protein [Maribacter sp. MJ134]AZQ57305.1 hypothetical protein EJ994_00210 [Maribacter sp. MJ134]
MSSDKTTNFSHIKFGFRGEGIIYKLNKKKYEVWSTYFEGITIFIDDLSNVGLNDEQKTKIFSEIIQFVNENEKEKPVVYYNSDYKDAKLWEKLTTKFSSLIKGTEVSTIEEDNIRLYKNMSDSLKTGLAEHNIRGLKIRTIKDLDKHWDKIKSSENASNNEVSFWYKLKSIFN